MKDTYYEAPAKGNTGAMCASCHEIKPLKEFKRKLNKLETQGRGKSGVNGMVVDSKYCNLCRPTSIRRTPAKEMRKRQLINAVEAGRIRQHDAEDLLNERERTARANMRGAVVARWDRQRAKLWAQVIKPINVEINAVKHQRYNAHRQGNAAILALATYYEDILIRTREKLRDLKANALKRVERQKSDITDMGKQTHKESTPSTMSWVAYVDDRTHHIHEMRRLWAQITPQQQSRCRVPEIFQTGGQDEEAEQTQTR